MSAVEVFRFDDSSIRTVLIDDEPWFVAADLAVVLGYRDASNAARLVDDDERGTHLVSTPGGQQRAIVVNEAGLYTLILRSDMPDAKRFRKWVTGVVLPSIRKTGGYAVTQKQMPSHPQALRGWAEALERAELAETKVAELEPKAAQAEHFREADGLIAVAQFANEIALWAREQHSVKVLHEQVRDFLGEIGLVIRSKGIRKNEPTAEALKRGFMRSKHNTIERSAGPQQKVSARFTPAGYGWAWDRAVRRIAEHGSLDKPKSVERQSA